MKFKLRTPNFCTPTNPHIVVKKLFSYGNYSYKISHPTKSSCYTVYAMIRSAYVLSTLSQPLQPGHSPAHGPMSIWGVWAMVWALRLLRGACPRGPPTAQEGGAANWSHYCPDRSHQKVEINMWARYKRNKRCLSEHCFSVQLCPRLCLCCTKCSIFCACVQ